MLRNNRWRLLAMRFRLQKASSQAVQFEMRNTDDGIAMLDCVTMRPIPIRLWALAILSGVLQVLPFPIAGPAPLWRTAFCWVALTPLLTALTGKDASGRPLRAIQGAALGYVSGFIWYLGNCYWVYATMHIYGGISKPAAAGILILFCLYLGLYHALFGALMASFQRVHLGGKRLGVQGALLLSPFAWVAVELARARITGFPWDLLGIAQVDNSLLTRLAPYVGAYGISFVIAAVNALWLVRITLKRRRYTRPALMAACVAILLLGVVFMRRWQGPCARGDFGDGDACAGEPGGGAPAASTGPYLTKSEMLQAFSELSMFPPAGGACNGIPELPGTHCAGPVPEQQGAGSGVTRYMQPTDLIVWPEAPNDFY